MYLSGAEKDSANGNIYAPDEVKIISEFKEQFENIKSKGFVCSHRSHNTGIGKTFEDLMGIDENNIQDVDFKNFLEIKSKREESNSMLTMFTKSPDYPRSYNRYLYDKYGILDESTGHKMLHTTINGKQFNTLGGKVGFKLIADDAEQKLFIQIKDLKTDELIEKDAYYEYSTLKKIIKTKCKNIAYVEAEVKIENDQECFQYTSAQLLTNCKFEKFIEGIKEGWILYDFRLGYYKSGKMAGKYHDHGSGFRILPKYYEKLFNIINL